MLTKTTIALTLAAVLGAASAALANEPVDLDGGGYRVQNWQAILAQGASRAQEAYNADRAYNAYGFVSPKHRSAFPASPTQGRRLSREND